jgi:hypothetical protein
MSACEAMQDRMPEVARGRSAWTEAEAAHLARCEECTQEWRLVRVGAGLHARTVIDVDQAATGVLARLRAEPVAVQPIRRIPWRGSLIGLLAAAASVALYVWAPRQAPSAGGEGTDTTVEIAVLPEMQQLSDSELEVVLQALGPTTADAAPGAVPHLEDLTDSELEQLLGSQGGQ